MRVLLTNDDGIDAPGIRVLEEIVRELGWDPIVIAPESDRSGIGRAISISEPMRMRKIDDSHYSVRGTPADCVLMGTNFILSVKPDLVLSGINRGQNAAEDVTASGTIGAAIEGVTGNIPSIALSQAYGFETRTQLHWETARKHGGDVLTRLAKIDQPENVFLNVNFPDCTPDQVAGMEVTRQGKRQNNAIAIDERIDGRGNPYYWLSFTRMAGQPAAGTDLDALSRNAISVTPLSTDLTASAAMSGLSEKLET